MSTQKLIGRAGSFAIALTFAGAAFARQPPALVQAQAADRAVAAEQGAGYRDAYARQHQSAGATAYAAAGYRDSLVRLSF